MGLAAPEKNSKPSEEGIHPDARASAGGTGYFRDMNPVLGDDVLSGTIRHARSPSSRLSIAHTSVALASAGAHAGKAKKPPSTKTLTKIIANESRAEVNIDVRVRVLPDNQNDRSIAAGSAKTRIMISRGLQSIAALSWDTRNGKVSGLSAKLVVRGVYEVQTSYGRKSKPTDPSRYGRGTTVKDKGAGDVTLGFHESCHREEFLDYLLNTPFPQFSGRIGMSESNFVDADTKFRQELGVFTRALTGLGAAVDEVGYKKSQCIADGKC